MRFAVQKNLTFGYLPSVRYFHRTQQKCLLPRRNGVVVCVGTLSHAVPFPSTKSATSSLPKTPETVEIKTVLPYLTKLVLADSKQHWRSLAAIALIIVAKVAGIAGPFFMKVAVEKVTAGPAFALQCVLNIFFFGICRSITGIANDLQYPVFSPVAQAAGRRLASAVFQHLLDLDIGFHLNNQTGNLSRIIDRGTRSVQMLFRTLFLRMIPTIVETIFVCGLFAHLFSPFVSGILMLTLTAYVAYSIKTIGISVGIRETMIELENKQSGKAIDALQNLETVLLFNNQQLEVCQYDGLLQGYQKASIAHEKIMAALSTGQGFITSVGVTLALVATVLVTSPGRLVTPGDLVMMQGIIAQLMVPLSFFGWFYRESRQGLTDMKEFLNILNTKSKMKDGTLDLSKAPKKSAHRNGLAPVPSNNASSFDNNISKSDHSNGSSPIHKGEPIAEHKTGGIEVKMEDVRFHYNPDREVLKGVTIDVPAGSSLALVGGSGSGKSTLLKLIVRLYDPTEGSIKFDGMNVKQLTTKSFRSAVGVVPQDTVLFNDTIFKNILYGRPDATPEEVYEAASLAQLDHAIRRLPQGFETRVGERGLKLSGGEKQRVAIARTFLRAPRLIVCDEATSSLDTATEKEIMSSLQRLAEGRTSIFVAHRLSTIQACDKIVVMANGRVVEDGTHHELMKMHGAYYDMWEAQAKSKALDNERTTSAASS